MDRQGIKRDAALEAFRRQYESYDQRSQQEKSAKEQEQQDNLERTAARRQIQAEYTSICQDISFKLTALYQSDPDAARLIEELLSGGESFDLLVTHHGRGFTNSDCGGGIEITHRECFRIIHHFYDQFQSTFQPQTHPQIGNGLDTVSYSPSIEHAVNIRALQDPRLLAATLIHRAEHDKPMNQDDLNAIR